MLFLEQDNITILPADKRNATVVMDTDKYKQKVTNMLDDMIYQKVKDPTPAAKRRVLKEVRELV